MVLHRFARVGQREIVLQRVGVFKHAGRVVLYVHIRGEREDNDLRPVVQRVGTPDLPEDLGILVFRRELVDGVEVVFLHLVLRAEAAYKQHAHPEGDEQDVYDDIFYKLRKPAHACPPIVLRRAARAGVLFVRRAVVVDGIVHGRHLCGVAPQEHIRQGALPVARVRLARMLVEVLAHKDHGH